MEMEPTAGNAAGDDQEDAMTVDSSSDEEEDSVYATAQFPNNVVGVVGSASVESNNNEATEEVVIKRNSEYLAQRCASLMQRLQGIMQGTSTIHVQRQLKAVLEHPGLNHHYTNNRTSSNNHHNKNSALHDHQVPPAHRLTKQGIAEVQFAGKVMTNIVRHSMGRQLDPNDDSATEESDTDDEEVVLPDDRMVVECGAGGSSECANYLPVENNPFIEAIKVEKQYEARRTSLEFSINECEFSLTKSLALRKHCKARKPLFQLEKPSTSTNVINIPVDATSSVKFYHDSKPATTKRVSEMMSQRRCSIETSPDKEKTKLTNGENGESNPPIASTSNNSPVKFEVVPAKATTSGSNSNATNSSQETSTKTNGTDATNERNAFIPTIKTMGSDGVSVLGVEFINSSDPNQSASRCAAIKRPDKNRKVFQLGGIQNIFRDTDRLPTVRCPCFGREELCALCLGRAKKKAEINHVHMSYKDKLAILDETFHKALSFPDDVPLESMLASNAFGNNAGLVKPTVGIQQLIKARSQQFPPDYLEVGPRPKKPRTYDIKPYVETPVRSPKKDGRYNEETSQSPRKRPPRKSQSSFEEKDMGDFAGKGLGRERKDSTRRTRNQEYDIDNIVIPYSMAATTRVEQLVYKPIETPRWREMDYDEIFPTDDKGGGEPEDMSNAAFGQRHTKCEVEEKKRFTQALQKAVNATRKTRRLDSTCRSESDPLGANSTGSMDGAPAAVDGSTVITEAMANQALKSLFKVGNRRRTVSTSVKVEEPAAPAAAAAVVVGGGEEEQPPPAPVVVVDPWPARKFPLPEETYKEMLDVMEQSHEDSMDYSSHLSHLEFPPLSPTFM